MIDAVCTLIGEGETTLDEYLNEALAMPYKWLKKNAEEIVKKRDYCDTDPDINCN